MEQTQTDLRVNNNNSHELSLHDQLLIIFSGRGFSAHITEEAITLSTLIRSTATTLKYVPVLPDALDSIPESYMEFVYFLWNKDLDTKNVVIL
jgi:hypothetical protein